MAQHTQAAEESVNKKESKRTSKSINSSIVRWYVCTYIVRFNLQRIVINRIEQN